MCVCIFLSLFTLEDRKRREREKNKPRWGGYAFQDGGGEQLLSFFSVLFVGGDREVRRYLFHSRASEIESNGSQILVRSEYGDEKVGEEIVSQGGVEKEVESGGDVIDIDFGVCVGESIVVAE